MGLLFTFLNGKIAPIQNCTSDALANELIKTEFEGEKRPVDPAVDKLIKAYGFDWDILSKKGYLTFKPYASFMVEAVKLRLWKQVQEFCGQNRIPLQRISGGDLYSLKSELMKRHVKLAEEVGMYGDGFLRVNDDQLLRFSGCSNKLSQLRNTPFDGATLPFGIFEISNSYRHEKEEDLSLLMRNRKFHLPELHIINENLLNGLEMLLRGHRHIDSTMKKHDLDYVMLFSTTRKFVDDNSWFIEKLCDGCAHPPIMNVFDDETCENGIVFDVEYKAHMQNGTLLEIGTLQIDEGNTDFSYGIIYRGKPVTTVHAVFFASSVERTLFTYIDVAASNPHMGKIPSWLAPVHCRIIPNNQEDYYNAEIILEQLSSMYRVELDDRNISVQCKLEDAMSIDVPYIIVVDNGCFLYDPNVDGCEAFNWWTLLEKQADESFVLGQFSPTRLSQRILF